MGKKNAKKIDIKGCRKIFGRIFLDSENTHSPFLLLKDGTVKLPIADVVSAIVEQKNANDVDIVSSLSVAGLRPDDISVLRAYIHRFGDDISHPKTINDHPDHVLLLDQNAPPSAILGLSHYFGWTTHVGGEGLVGRNFPDEDIWDFADKNAFQAIVTRDADFLGIQKNRAVQKVKNGDTSVPVLLFISHNLNAGILMNLFKKHAGAIRNGIEGKTNLAYQLCDEKGMSPLF